MADALQTAQDFFGASPPAQTPSQSSSLPSAEDFFGHSDAMVGSYPQSGAAHDTFWSAPLSAYSRILNAAGYGVQQAWGSEPLGMSPEDESQLRKIGVINDYAKGDGSTLKAVNEAIIRPAVTAADIAIRALKVPFGLVAGASGQTAQEIQGEHPTPLRTAIATPFGGLGEMAGAAPEGFIPELGPIGHAIEATRARSVGVLGEGEAGYHEVAPLTPENVQARTAAAKESGTPEPVPEPPASPSSMPKEEPVAPDIHELARNVDPETFQKYDALAIQKDQARNTLERLAVERQSSPEVKQASADIEDILQGQDASHIESVFEPDTPIRQRLSAAQDRPDAALRTDTPAMAEARKSLVDADIAQRDLVPDVASAYRQAQDMVPPEVRGHELTPEQNETVASAYVGPEEAAKAKTTAPEGYEAPSLKAEALNREFPKVAPKESSAEEVSGKAPNVVGDQTLGGTERAPVEGTGELKERGLAKSVKAKALEDGLSDTFGDLPQYRRLNMEDQAAKAIKVIKNDYEAAKAMAMGDKSPPKDILPATMFVAVENHARAIGDVDTIRDLATKSKLLEQATEAGRTIRTYGERDPHSPVKAIQEVQKAREEAAGSRGKVDVEKEKAKDVADMKSEIRKASSPRPKWEDFIRAIQCEV